MTVGLTQEAQRLRLRPAPKNSATENTENTEEEVLGAVPPVTSQEANMFDATDLRGRGGALPRVVRVPVAPPALTAEGISSIQPYSAAPGSGAP
jgi:hypothetical protein